MELARRAATRTCVLAGAGCALLLAACGSEPRGAQASTAASPPEPDFDVVLLVSVDGLRSDALIALPPGSLPGFDRLRQGAHTLNARTDPDRTVTLPNHTGMLTGRLVEGAGGHAWIRNDEVLDGETIQAKKGAYVACAFDVAHDRGAWTSIFAGKPKFHLFDDSWDATRGAADVCGTDEGCDKVDQFLVDPVPENLASGLIAELTRSGGRAKRLYFVHFAAPDLVGHVKGWDVTKGSHYLQAVADVDAALARILFAIESTPALRGRTAVVLTSDHGGGAPFRSHDQPHMWVDYVIPFLVWTGGAEPADLYAVNATTRRDPGLGRPRPEDGKLPPVRNSDAGNLALDLLGFPAIPGSTVNAAQDLRAVMTPAR